MLYVRNKHLNRDMPFEKRLHNVIGFFFITIIITNISATRDRLTLEKKWALDEVRDFLLWYEAISQLIY